MNTWKRKALAVAAVVLLSVPSAVGVYAALAPTRGPVAAGFAAAGFELVYLSTALLLLRPALRAYARNVALSAVGVAVALNTLADYQARVPGGLSSAGVAVARFDALALLLSVIESAPLAILAYAMASLLHRLSEDDSAVREVLSDLLHSTPPPLQVTQAVQVNVAQVERPALADDTPALAAAPRALSDGVPALADDAVALSDGAPILSKTARVKQLAVEHGVSETTMWRKVRAGEVEV